MKSVATKELIVKPEESYVKRLLVKENGQNIFLPCDQVSWIESAGNYILVHVGQKSYMIRETMTHLEHKLNPDQFVRVHRSTMVNLDFVKELEPLLNQEYAIRLNDDTRIVLSKTYRSKFVMTFHSKQTASK